MLPEGIDQELWEAFCDMRRQMKRVPFTQFAQKLILQKLEQFKEQGYDPNLSLREAIERGWRGVWPCGEPKRKETPKTVFTTEAPLSQHMQVVNWSIQESQRTGRSADEIKSDVAVRGKNGWEWKA